MNTTALKSAIESENAYDKEEAKVLLGKAGLTGNGYRLVPLSSLPSEDRGKLLVWNLSGQDETVVRLSVDEFRGAADNLAGADSWNQMSFQKPGVNLPDGETKIADAVNMSKAAAEEFRKTVHIP